MYPFLLADASTGISVFTAVVGGVSVLSGVVTTVLIYLVTNTRNDAKERVADVSRRFDTLEKSVRDVEHERVECAARIQAHADAHMDRLLGPLRKQMDTSSTEADALVRRAAEAEGARVENQRSVATALYDVKKDIRDLEQRVRVLEQSK